MERLIFPPNYSPIPGLGIQIIREKQMNLPSQLVAPDSYYNPWWSRELKRFICESICYYLYDNYKSAEDNFAEQRGNRASLNSMWGVI